MTIEDRLANIEKNTLSELNAGIALLETKRNRALAVGAIVGTVVAAVIGIGGGRKREVMALVAGFGTALISGKLAYRYV